MSQTKKIIYDIEYSIWKTSDPTKIINKKRMAKIWIFVIFFIFINDQKLKYVLKVYDIF